MFNQQGLSLEQAPPISVVFRFFLGGALFGLLASLLLLIFGEEVFNIASPQSRIITHTLTLGVMLSFMFAALFQMLPVIAGVTLTSPKRRANWVQYPFYSGLILLLVAFYAPSPERFMLASLLLGGSIIPIAGVMIEQLRKVVHHSPSSKGMLFALSSLLLLTLFALYMTASQASLLQGEYYLQVKTIHYSFGLIGWITLLIIAISFQVIEMFYVTPPYPSWMRRYLTAILFMVLLLSSVISLFLPQVWLLSGGIIGVLLSLYALTTLKRLTQRKRPLADATVWFWRVGMSLLLATLLTLTLTLFIPNPILFKLVAILFSFFALSVVFAMFYKIVPFLTWFHLNSQGYFNAPMMHEIIHPKTAMKHLYLHLASLSMFLLSLGFGALFMVASFMLLLSFSILVWHILYASRCYIKTQQTQEKFTLNP